MKNAEKPKETAMSTHTLSRAQFLQGVAALATASVIPTEDRFAEAKAFIEKHIADGTIPGATLIASKNGKVAVRYYAGNYLRQTVGEKPVTADVLHPLYSFSKLVSATVVAMAVQDKLLSYDTNVSSIIPEFTGGGKDSISLRHLLSHSAGIPNVPLGNVHTELGWKACVKTACEAKTEWQPGSRTAYHALSGLFVAAEMMRRKMGGAGWNEICRKRLFGPIGAKSMLFGMPAETGPVSLTPRPASANTKMEVVFPYAGHPAGGCFGTVEDCLKVLQLHLNGGTWKGKRLLDSKVLAEMHTVVYQKERDAARTAGKPVVHENWGLGPLLRGTGPSDGGHSWFGFANQSHPGIFGHAGIDTVIGVADSETGNALFFVSTNSPKPQEKVAPLRNGVTVRVFAALG